MHDADDHPLLTMVHSDDDAYLMWRFARLKVSSGWRRVMYWCGPAIVLLLTMFVSVGVAILAICLLGPVLSTMFGVALGWYWFGPRQQRKERERLERQVDQARYDLPRATVRTSGVCASSGFGQRCARTGVLWWHVPEAAGIWIDRNFVTYEKLHEVVPEPLYDDELVYRYIMRKRPKIQVTK